MDNKLKNWVINLLRRGTFRWGPRGVAEKRFKVPNGLYKNGKPKFGYKCNDCKKIFMKKDTVTDHTDPVIPMEGFSSFDTYIERMFCDEDNFQCLCIKCHDQKTTLEKDFRKRWRANEDKSVLRKEWEDFLDKYK